MIFLINPSQLRMLPQYRVSLSAQEGVVTNLFGILKNLGTSMLKVVIRWLEAWGSRRVPLMWIPVSVLIGGEGFFSVSIRLSMEEWEYMEHYGPVYVQFAHSIGLWRLINCCLSTGGPILDPQTQKCLIVIPPWPKCCAKLLLKCSNGATYKARGSFPTCDSDVRTQWNSVSTKQDLVDFFKANKIELLVFGGTDYMGLRLV
ncbi:hypothetical protein EZV62_020438 [Acer yangbiense]|uniref:Uncharacterized protein n=1 Tax=Acer yangbiense TaxID=1000413 RepID=A0A5C7HFE3_9ROSI|nr:hypothetical protein EZV62_020438 [Acer yangbiense]